MVGYFLSYARADAEIALKLARDIAAAGVVVWVDQFEIHPSQHWDRAIEAALRESAGLIVVLSPRSAASSNVADEVSLSIDAGKRVIPVMVEACSVPLRMTRIQYIDATQDYTAALAALVRALEAEPPPAPVAQADPPPIASPVATLPDAAIKEAQRALTPILGPIAAVMVRRAAARSTSVEAFIQTLQGALEREPDRAAFRAAMARAAPPGPRRAAPVASAAAAAPTPRATSAIVFQQDDLDRIARALTQHLGPIAPRLTAREAQTAASLEDLCGRLGARIIDPADRARFMREAVSSRASRT